MKPKQAIPVHLLSESAPSGFRVHHVDQFSAGELAALSAHRDEYYVFIYVEQGEAVMMVDFEEVSINGPAVLSISPGQVHHGIMASNLLAWFIMMDTSWITEHYRSIFRAASPRRQAVPLSPPLPALLDACLQLLASLNREAAEDPAYQEPLRAQATTLISLWATGYTGQDSAAARPDTRTALITHQFKDLLQEQFRTVKSPTAYAAALHISPAYLTEAVKMTTGFPVSYWIQQEVMLEAKRLLYYTDHTVKEIAGQLGYEDPTYFNRLFHKIAGRSPLRFRQQYRK